MTVANSRANFGRGQSPRVRLVVLFCSLMLVSSSLGAQGETMVLRVKVIDRDTGKPIGGATIEDDSEPVKLWRTAENGLVAVECRKNSQLQAYDTGLGHYGSRPKRCSADDGKEELTFSLTAISVGITLESAYMAAAEARAYPRAAQAANELSWDVEVGRGYELSWIPGEDASDSEEVLGRKAELLTYYNLGKHFGVREPVVFDVQQGKEVMSPELSAAIRAFQKERGIPETGRADGATLSEMTGVTSGALRTPAR